MRTHDECNEFSRSCVKKKRLWEEEEEEGIIINRWKKKRTADVAWSSLDVRTREGHLKGRRRSDWRARFAKKSTKSVGMEELLFYSFAVRSIHIHMLLFSCFWFRNLVLPILLHLPSSEQPSVVRAPVHMASPSPSAGKAPTPPSHLSEKLSGWWYPCRERSPRATLSRVTRLDKRFADFVDSKAEITTWHCQIASFFVFLW